MLQAWGSDCCMQKIKSLGGLEPPTSRLTVERANQLRHKDNWQSESKVWIYFNEHSPYHVKLNLFLDLLSPVKNHKLSSKNQDIIKTTAFSNKEENLREKRKIFPIFLSRRVVSRLLIVCTREGREKCRHSDRRSCLARKMLFWLRPTTRPRLFDLPVFFVK